MVSCISKKEEQERNKFYHVHWGEAANFPFLDLLERPLEVATLGMDGAPSLEKG
jgi:hypothetical protein